MFFCLWRDSGLFSHRNYCRAIREGGGPQEGRASSSLLGMRARAIAPTRLLRRRRGRTGKALDDPCGEVSVHALFPHHQPPPVLRLALPVDGNRDGGSVSPGPALGIADRQP